MTLEEWQVALRRSYGRDQKLKLKEIRLGYFGHVSGLVEILS